MNTEEICKILNISSDEYWDSFLKTKKVSGILRYTDYKREQALWLQQKDNERGVQIKTFSSEQFFMKCYKEYLYICGYENDYIIKLIDFVSSSIEPEQFMNKRKKPNKIILDNVNDIMNFITDGL